MDNNTYETLCAEFVAAVQAILKKLPVSPDADSVAVERARLLRMLDQHTWLVSGARLYLWRDLGFLVTDSEAGRARKRVRVDGKLQSMICIDLAVWRRLKEIPADVLAQLHAEYMRIVKSLLAQPEPWRTGCKDNRLVVLRPELTEALERRNYMTAEDKLAVWRDLHWIDAEPGRTRKQIRVGGGKRIYNAIQIDLRPYEAMLHCREIDKRKQEEAEDGKVHLQ